MSTEELGGQKSQNIVNVICERPLTSIWHSTVDDTVDIQ